MVRLIGLVVLTLSACTPRGDSVQRTGQALGYAVETNAPDAIAVDGVCSFREAWRAASHGIAAADCPNGGNDSDGYRVISLSAGTWVMAIANPSPVQTEDTLSAVGDLDESGNAALRIRVLGAGVGATILDAAGLDRIFHVKNLASLDLRDLTLRNGCVNGGSCATATAGSEPVGGLAYFNAAGSFRSPRTAWENGRARTGGALGLCSMNDSDGSIDGATFTGNSATVGGGAIDSHTTWSCTACTFTGNSTAGLGGALRQYDRIVTLIASDMHGNAAAQAGGAAAMVGQWNASTSGHLTAINSTITGNSSAKGGNVYVGASGVQGQGGLYSVPCSASGCGADFYQTNLTIGSAPVGPDCSGTVDLWSGSTVSNPSGCNAVSHGPVCGNGIVEAGEACDGGQCCTMACAYASEGSACSDGDACTPSDACDGAGECIPGGTTCGDGIVQAECGEVAVESCGG